MYRIFGFFSCFVFLIKDLKPTLSIFLVNVGQHVCDCFFYCLIFWKTFYSISVMFLRPWARGDEYASTTNAAKEPSHPKEQKYNSIISPWKQKSLSKLSHSNFLCKNVPLRSCPLASLYIVIYLRQQCENKIHTESQITFVKNTRRRVTDKIQQNIHYHI